MKSIEKRIFEVYESLSPSERQFADVLLQQPQEIISHTALELSAKANVSNATAARLIRRLGYRSMGDAKRQVRAAQHWGSPLERLEDKAEAGATGISIMQLAMADAANAKMTVEGLPAADLERATAILKAAPRIWILGVRHGFGLAHLARNYLGLSRGNVHVIPGGAALSDDFGSLKSGDAMLVFAFRRRPQHLMSLLAEIKKIGVRTIVIGDMSIAAGNIDIDVTIRCWCQSPAPFMSFSAAVTVINYISWVLIEELGDESVERLKKLENIMKIADDVEGGVSEKTRKK